MLRAAGRPALEDPGGDDDTELDGRDLIGDRLLDEAPSVTSPCLRSPGRPPNMHEEHA